MAEDVTEPEVAPVMSRLEEIQLPPPEPIMEPVVEEEPQVPVTAEPTVPASGFTAMQRLSQATEPLPRPSGCGLHGD